MVKKGSRKYGKASPIRIEWNGGDIYDLLIYRKYKEYQEERDEERDTQYLWLNIRYTSIKKYLTDF